MCPQCRGDPCDRPDGARGRANTRFAPTLGLRSHSIENRSKRFHSALGLRFPLPRAGEGQGEGVSERSSRPAGFPHPSPFPEGEGKKVRALAKSLNRLLKKSDSCFDRLSTNGKSPTILSPPPFALSLSKGERRVFQHPVKSDSTRFVHLSGCNKSPRAARAPSFGSAQDRL